MTQGINADGSYAYGGRCANLPGQVRETIIRPDIQSMSTVLDTIKTKPDGGRLSAASLDSVCARWRLRFAVGAGESLRRGRTKEINRSRKIALAFWAAIRERRPRCMYGRRPRCKRNLTLLRYDRVRSCIRPVIAAALAAGHDVIRGSGPNQGDALLNRVALHGFSRSNGSTVSHHVVFTPAIRDR